MTAIDLKEIKDLIEAEGLKTAEEEFAPGEYEAVCKILDQTRQDVPEYAFVVGEINAYMG